MNRDEANDEEYQECTDNTIVVLFKLWFFQKDDTFATDKVLWKVLELLPLKKDLEENEAVTKIFIKGVFEHSENLFGKDNCNHKEIYCAIHRILEFQRKIK